MMGLFASVQEKSFDIVAQERHIDSSMQRQSLIKTTAAGVAAAAVAVRSPRPKCVMMLSTTTRNVGGSSSDS